MKYKDFLNKYAEEALAHDKEDAAVLMLLEDASGLSNTKLFLALEDEVPNEVSNKFMQKYDRYLNHNEPVQYLIGYACFYGYDFIVNKDVLIPRPETEELVENVLLKYDKYFKGQKVNVCDLATGSGCIAVTLAKEEKNMNVTATDISKEALAVAKENALKMGVNINFKEGDMLAPLEDMKFDIFVSNPPYIPDNEIVDPLVKDNEPNVALFGGSDGLKFYRIILRDLKKHLNNRALIAFEHGYDKKIEIEEIARTYFKDARIETLKDLEGRDRMTFIYVNLD